MKHLIDELEISEYFKIDVNFLSQAGQTKFNVYYPFLLDVP